MAIQIWEATEGKVISFLYEDGKNKKILHVRDSTEIGNLNMDMVDEIDNAMKTFVKYIARISDVEKIDKGKENVVNVIIENAERVDERGIDSIERVDEKCVDSTERDDEKRDDEKRVDSIERYDEKMDNGNEIHEEAEDKLNLLKEVDKPVRDGVRDGVQYLIDVNARKNITDKNVETGSVTTGQGNIKIIPKEDVVGIKRKSRKSRSYHEYEEALKPHIQELLDKIKNTGAIVVRISDMVEELGEQFSNKSTTSIYIGVRHALFNHGIKVEQCTLKEIDPVTQHGKKGLKMRMFGENDSVPSSIRRLQ